MPVDRLSSSKLSAFLRCPRQFRFRYLDRLPKERRSTAACFGTAVHSSIAWWQKEMLEGRPATAADAASVFQADWTAEWSVGDLEFAGQNKGQLLELGRALVDCFISEVGIVPDTVDTGFEVPLTLDGVELPVPLVGYYDYVVGNTIGEIKTTARSSGPSQWWLQLTAYAYSMLVQGRSPVIQLVMLVKTKTPRAVVVEHHVDDVDIGRFLAVAEGVVRSVAEGVFYPNPGWMCRCCEYRDACQAMTGPRAPAVKTQGRS